MTTENISYGTWTEFTLTNLVSLASDLTSPYAGWQSVRVDNQTTTKATDYEVMIHLAHSSTAAASPAAAYFWVVPWVYDGSSWNAAGNFGTTTEPTGSEGTASIDQSNSMKGPYPIPYVATGQTLEGYFTVAQLCGIVPDGWSLAVAIATSSGGTLLDDSPGTELVIAYRAITYTSA